MEKIILNSLIKSTKKTYNHYLWLNILSAQKEKKKVFKSNNYIEVDDYLIEYILVYENENGNKVKNKNFTYHAYLSEFGDKEKKFIMALIKLKAIVNEKIKQLVTEPVMVN